MTNIIHIFYWFIFSKIFWVFLRYLREGIQLRVIQYHTCNKQCLDRWYILTWCCITLLLTSYNSLGFNPSNSIKNNKPQQPQDRLPMTKICSSYIDQEVCCIYVYIYFIHKYLHTHTFCYINFVNYWWSNFKFQKKYFDLHFWMQSHIWLWEYWIMRVNPMYLLTVFTKSGRGLNNSRGKLYPYWKPIRCVHFCHLVLNIPWYCYSNITLRLIAFVFT